MSVVGYQSGFIMFVIDLNGQTASPSNIQGKTFRASRFHGIGKSTCGCEGHSHIFMAKSP